MSEHKAQRHCMECDSYYDADLKKCPNCGYVYKKDRETEAVTDAIDDGEPS